ncbi:DUF4870 domain-containing protein [Metabacillus herbersteinensis]|uniref:DUF4870 domain-containing protein n=1 Tax=Metabacillus herbersteinensis TaxID=283816 RepID=A0ABV6GI10_9BACI
MATNRVISSLCYFSVFFAPFILPIAIYFIVDDEEVKNDAKKSLISHIIPILTLIGLVAMVIFSSMANAGEGIFLSLFFGGFIVVGILNLVVFIWNIVKGIKVLQKA